VEFEATMVIEYIFDPCNSSPAGAALSSSRSLAPVAEAKTQQDLFFRRSPRRCREERPESRKFDYPDGEMKCSSTQCQRKRWAKNDWEPACRYNKALIRLVQVPELIKASSLLSSISQGCGEDCIATCLKSSN